MSVYVGSIKRYPISKFELLFLLIYSGDERIKGLVGILHLLYKKVVPPLQEKIVKISKKGKNIFVLSILFLIRTFYFQTETSFAVNFQIKPTVGVDNYKNAPCNLKTIN